MKKLKITIELQDGFKSQKHVFTENNETLFFGKKEDKAYLIHGNQGSVLDNMTEIIIAGLAMKKIDASDVIAFAEAISRNAEIMEKESMKVRSIIRSSRDTQEEEILRRVERRKEEEYLLSGVHIVDCNNKTTILPIYYSAMDDESQVNKIASLFNKKAIYHEDATMVPLLLGVSSINAYDYFEIEKEEEAHDTIVKYIDHLVSDIEKPFLTREEIDSFAKNLEFLKGVKKKFSQRR